MGQCLTHAKLPHGHHHQQEVVSPASTPPSTSSTSSMIDMKKKDPNLTLKLNEIPCMFFAWLVYDLKLYNNLTGTIYSANTGHELLRGYGEWSIVQEFYRNTKMEIVHAIIAVCDERKEVIVAFRGTQSTFSDPTQRVTTVNDWLYGCFDAHLTYWDKAIQNSGSVHHGFFKHYCGIGKEIPLKLKEYVLAGYTVTFTGHSQGGALAVYASLEVAQYCPVARKNIYLITFGAPKVGNKRFIEYYKQLVPPQRVMRYITSYPAPIPIYDAVTRVPPPIMKFRQVYGQKRFVMVPTEDFGKVSVDIGNVSKMVPLSFMIHFKETYYKGILSGSVCYKPFKAKCAKLLLEELPKHEEEFKSAMCKTYRSIHNVDLAGCPCEKPEELPDPRDIID